MPVWSIPAIAKVGTWLGIGKAVAGSAAAAGVIGSLGSSAAQYGFGRKALNDQAAINEHMYRHRYQWTMDDMRNAGLNPILAAKGGLVGSSPSVGLPQINRGEMTSSARDVQDIRNLKAKARLTLQQTYHEIQKNWLTRVQAGKAFAEETKLVNEVKNVILEFDRIAAETERIRAQTAREHADIEKIRQHEVLLRQEAKKLMNLMTQLEQESEIYKGFAGRILKSVKETFDALNLHIVVGAGVR